MIPQKAPLYFLILTTILGTIRSLIHMFAPDSGALSIAGIALEGDLGANLVAIVGQWGASQFVEAMMGMAIIIRYRQLTSFMLGIQLLELVLRACIGLMKPLIVLSPPPGAYGTWILLPLTAFFWILSLRSNYPSHGASEIRSQGERH